MIPIRHIIFCLVLLPFWLNAQQTTTAELLRTVETNNKDLSAYRNYVQTAVLQYNSLNNLPDPEASAYVLPFGSTEAGNYTEFELSQRVEFPSVYSERSKWIDRQEEQLNSEYQKKRQDILLTAKKLTLKFIFTGKQKQLADRRIDQSRQVYQHLQTLYEKGEVGILELNKAKVAWVDQQFAVKEIENTRESILRELQALNGGLVLTPRLERYPDSLTNPDRDSLWSVKVREDPQFLILNNQNEVAAQRIEVEQSKKLPDLKLGFNHQGVPGNNIYGFIGGISIPLWNGKHKVEAARAKLEYTDRKRDAEIAKAEGKFHQRMQRYQFLLDKYEEYRGALNGLESDSLLRASYRIGEISFLDYYREIQFYRNAQDRMIEMEHELHELKAILLRHQL